MSARRVVHGRSQLLGELLAELDSPLVEGVDPPHQALSQHAVLVERDELAERRRVQLLEENDSARTAAGIDLVRNERRDARRWQPLAYELCAHGVRALSRHQRLRLRKAARDGEVLLRLG